MAICRFEVVDHFKENNIEIPSPQMEVKLLK